jgi:1,2-diacylglycerol 3-beta-galactosyltransferase
MLDIARQLAVASPRIQLIFLCGRNETLVRRLRHVKLPFPVHVQGFTEDVVRYMWLSDFFVGKPGPGSVSEALAMRLPVIVHAGARTMAQERFNVEWIKKQGLGIPVRSIRAIPRVVEELMRPGVRRRMLRNIGRLNNRAVFEVPEILDRILAGHPDSFKTIHHLDVSSDVDQRDIAV